MIDGEHGSAILQQVFAYKMDSLIDGDSITTSLIGACIADALRKGETPKHIAWQLWEGLPDDFSWDAQIRDQVVRAVDELEEHAA